MPYIKKEDRQRLDLGGSNEHRPQTPGELNFVITKLIVKYLQDAKLNYQHINDVLGALEGAKMEFYRRVVVPYEDMKCDQNGDVY